MYPQGRIPYPPAGVRAAAGSGGMGHPALRSPGQSRPSRLAQNTKCIRRGGFHIRPRTFAPPRGPAGWGIPPYGRPDRRGHSGWPKIKKLFVGAGFIPPAEPCTTAFPRLVSVFPPLRRAGVHARRTLAISKSKPCAAANRADISGLRAGPAVFGLRNAPAGAVESAPTRVAGSRGLRLPGIPARKKNEKIPNSSFSSRS